MWLLSLLEPAFDPAENFLWLEEDKCSPRLCDQANAILRDRHSVFSGHRTSGDWEFWKACPVRTRQRKLKRFGPKKTKLKCSIRWYPPIIKSHTKCHCSRRSSLTMAPPKKGQLPVITLIAPIPLPSRTSPTLGKSLFMNIQPFPPNHKLSGARDWVCPTHYFGQHTSHQSQGDDEWVRTTGQE